MVRPEAPTSLKQLEEKIADLIDEDKRVVTDGEAAQYIARYYLSLPQEDKERITFEDGEIRVSLESGKTLVYSPNGTESK